MEPRLETLSINAPALLRELTRTSGVTRLELQHALKVSGPTITRAILELTDLGIVESRVNAAGGKGRPAETVDLSENGLCAISVSIRAGRVTVDLVDARGQLVESHRLPIGEQTDYAEALSLIGRTVLDTAGSAAQRFRCLAGVGISFGGSADYATGAITTPSAFRQWRGKPMARDLEFYTGLPTAIDNYSIALVGVLNWFDPAKPSDFFMVVADYGIGGVSSIEGRSYLGPERRPGSFGHIGGRRAGRFACHCGACDCMDATSSVKAIDRDAKALQPGGETRDLAELLRTLDASPDAAARSLLTAAGERIAESALALCRGMGLTSCVFGGMLFDNSAAARAAAEEVFAAPGHACEPRFLCRLFETRLPDDLAAASVAYQLLSDRRQVYMLDSGHSGEAVRLRARI